MNATGAAPVQARCAGLRHALLHDWSEDFPVEPSPFQTVARRVGGSLREVLGHCRALQGEGSLDRIAVHWGGGLQRAHWRCSVPAGWPIDDAALDDLAALPGVVGWDRAEDPSAAQAAGHPGLEFDLVARDEASAAAQLGWFEDRHGPPARVALADEPAVPEGCDCRERGGPCSDPSLARFCEAGLPVVAHPFRVVAEHLQRTEREVIATLRRWQRQGRLRAVGLEAPPSASETRLVAALVDGPAISAVQRSALLQRPGVLEVERLPAHAAWRCRTRCVVGGDPVQAAGVVGRALAACGLADRPHALLAIRRVRWRVEPRLFAPIGQAPVGKAPGGRAGTAASA